MGASYQQTGTVAGAANIVACSGGVLMGSNQEKTSLCVAGGTAGGAVTVGGSAFDAGAGQAGVMFEIVPGGTSWAAGNYVVRLNVTTATGGACTWTDTYICRLNSSNVSQATIGSLTGQTTPINSTGVKTHTVSGASQTPAVGDKVYIVCLFNSPGANQTFGVTFNQLIDTPLLSPKTFSATDPWANLADSIGIVRVGPWRDYLAYTLATVGAGTTPKTFSGSDSVNLWTDTLGGRRVERAGLSDAWQNLADSRAGRLRFFASLADPAANLADSANVQRKGLHKLVLTDPWNNLADSVTGFRRVRAGLTDPWGTLADSLTRLIGDHKVLFYADALAFWADFVAVALGVPTGVTPKTFSATDALNLWNDVLVGFRRERAGLTDSALNLADSLAGLRRERVGLTDPWANLADSAAQLRKVLYKLSLTDSWQNLSDSPAARLRFRAALTDTLNFWVDLVARTITTGATPKTFSGTDVWGTLAELPLYTRGLYTASLTDTWNNLSDSKTAQLKFRAALQDSLNLWADLVAKTLTTLTTPKTFTGTDVLNFADLLAGFRRERAGLTDPWANLVDSLAGLRRERVGLTDPWANLADSVIQFERGLYRLSLTDPWANLADTLAGFRRERAGLTDTAQNLSDSLAALRRMRVALQDSMTQADSIAALFKYRASLIDNAANLADLLTLFLLAPNLRLGLTDSWQNLNDVVQAREALLARLADDGRNLDDLLALILESTVVPSEPIGKLTTLTNITDITNII